MKILIIEDHPKIRENIKKFLKISWYLAEIAINWKDWLDKVIYWDYDLIILDVNMPVMNWKEFMINMRKLSKNIPVIALTSNSLLDDKIEMFDKEKPDWTNAILKYGLTWKHVSDLKYWDSEAARLYAVNSIPATVLIDKNGKIVGRNLELDEMQNLLNQQVTK